MHIYNGLNGIYVTRQWLSKVFCVPAETIIYFEKRCVIRRAGTISGQIVYDLSAVIQSLFAASMLGAVKGKQAEKAIKNASNIVCQLMEASLSKNGVNNTRNLNS